MRECEGTESIQVKTWQQLSDWPIGCFQMRLAGTPSLGCQRWRQVRSLASSHSALSLFRCSRGVDLRQVIPATYEGRVIGSARCTRGYHSQRDSCGKTMAPCECSHRQSGFRVIALCRACLTLCNGAIASARYSISLSGRRQSRISASISPISRRRPSRIRASRPITCCLQKRYQTFRARRTCSMVALVIAPN